MTLGRCRPERVPTTRVPRGPGGPEDVAGRCSDTCRAVYASPSPPGATVRRRFSPAEASGSGQGGAAQTRTSVTRVRFAFRRGARVPAPGPASTPRASRPLPRLLGVVSRSLAEWRYCGPARAARARGSLGGWGGAAREARPSPRRPRARGGQTGPRRRRPLSSEAERVSRRHVRPVH